MYRYRQKHCLAIGKPMDQLYDTTSNLAGQVTGH